MPSSVERRIRFVKAAIADGNVAAVTNSSKYVVTAVMRQLPVPLTTVVEYGPGDGVATQALLRRLPAHGRLLAIESNIEFYKLLRKIRDPRLQVVHGNARDTAAILLEYRMQAPDAVISSIPFSFLTEEERHEILAQTRELLPAHGVFIVFHQYSRLALKPLRAHFESVTMSFELRNVFPCFTFCATNRAAGY
jgi:phospholipid N-methyltransferase